MARRGANFMTWTSGEYYIALTYYTPFYAFRLRASRLILGASTPVPRFVCLASFVSSLIPRTYCTRRPSRYGVSKNESKPVGRHGSVNSMTRRRNRRGWVMTWYLNTGGLLVVVGLDVSIDCAKKKLSPRNKHLVRFSGLCDYPVMIFRKCEGDMK